MITGSVLMVHQFHVEFFSFTQALQPKLTCWLLFVSVKTMLLGNYVYYAANRTNFVWTNLSLLALTDYACKHFF